MITVYTTGLNILFFTKFTFGVHAKLNTAVKVMATSNYHQSFQYRKGLGKHRNDRRKHTCINENVKQC